MTNVDELTARVARALPGVDAGAAAGMLAEYLTQYEAGVRQGFIEYSLNQYVSMGGRGNEVSAILSSAFGMPDGGVFTVGDDSYRSLHSLTPARVRDQVGSIPGVSDEGMEYGTFAPAPVGMMIEPPKPVILSEDDLREAVDADNEDEDGDDDGDDDGYDD